MTCDIPTSDGPSRESADAIAAALARLRGRRGPGEDGPGGRGPWERGRNGHRGRDHTGIHGHDHGDQHDHGDHAGGEPPWARSMRGGPDGVAPWMAGAHARFGGPARLRLLEALTAASTPLSVGELADAIGVDQPRASRLVQQSVAMSLVRREADPDDARRTRIALTDDGATLLSRLRGGRRDAIESALAAFSDQERDDLARLLTKFAQAWPR